MKVKSLQLKSALKAVILILIFGKVGMIKGHAYNSSVETTLGLMVTETNNPETDYLSQYFTIESLSDNNTITLFIPKRITSEQLSSVSYSTDGTNWITNEIEASDQWIDITLNQGETAYLKGMGKQYGIDNSINSYSKFSSTNSFMVYGNIMSLLYGDDFASQTEFPDESHHTFFGLFSHCTNLISANNLLLPATELVDRCYWAMFSTCTSMTTTPILPATTLANDCYHSMFYGCSSLVEAPSLPATTLAECCYMMMFESCTSLTEPPILSATSLMRSCYMHMFAYCSSLTEAPVLPATTLANNCYHSMFYGCSTLVEAPTLPATTLVDNCYFNMFSGCTSLNEVSCLATDISALDCTTNWLYDVATNGTFHKNPEMQDWTLNNPSGVPEGWIVPEINYEITASANPIEAGSILGAGTYTHGETCTLTAIANEGFRFIYWTKNNEIVSTEATYSIPVTEQGNYVAIFIKPYFTLESLADNNTITLTIPSQITTEQLTSVSYSTDGINWFTTDINATDQTISVVLNQEEKVYFKGTGTQYAKGTANYYYSNFSATEDFKVYGNIMSLLYGDDFVSQTEFPSGSTNTFCGLFRYCANLISAEDLVLPSMTLVEHCYSHMFLNCTSLEETPILPAITLADNCYEYMFRGCESLTEAPALPATTLANYCYSNMFFVCTSLTEAPALPATTLANSCYSYMFRGCSSLTEAPELPATTLTSSCYSSMFSGCTSLTEAPELPAIALALFCYSEMFHGCTSLVEGPELPATTLPMYCYQFMFGNCASLSHAPQLPAINLSTSCYRYMFYGCVSLTETPHLLATTLADYCYSGMFSGCTSLNEVYCLAYDISAPDCTTNWLNGVSATGIFHKNSEMQDWSLNNPSGIPENWTITDYYNEITTSVNPANAGMITGEGAYIYGETCTLIATANEGYTFTNWTKDGEVVSTEASYSFTVTEEATFVANFEETQVIYYIISASPNPSSGGSITGAGTYMNGQTCTLAAAANEGYTFGSWSENGTTVSTDATYSFTVDSDRTLVANFAAVGNHWTPENTGNYSLTMALTGIVQIDGVEQYSDQLEVGAFCGDECRGSQMASEFFLTNRYLVMLSIVGEIDDVLTFKLYDHGLAQELDLTSPNPVTFINDGYGTPIEPYELNFISIVEINALSVPEGAGTIVGSGSYTKGTTCTLIAEANAGFQFENWTLDGVVVSTDTTYEFTVTQEASYIAHFQYVHTQALSSGWNWYSTYINQDGINGLATLENSLGSNGVRILSKSNGYVDQYEYNGTSYWYGTLNAITNEQMYMVRTSAACNAVMTGDAAQPSNHPITINNGWNWIGFPCSHNVSVDVAMSSFTPESNDIIKGRNNYTTYYSDGNYNMWYGTLNTFEPGKGYMYRSISTVQKTLVFQTGREQAEVANITTEGNLFQPVSEDFADNMTVTAVLEVEGEELRSDDYELAAFVGEECRGSVRLMYVEPIDRYVAFLTIFGDQQETLQFRLTDGTQDGFSSENMTYSVDGSVGTLNEPAVLHFGTLTVDESANANVMVYPNPSEGLFNLEGQGIRKVEVFNAFGQLILSKEMENGFMQVDLTRHSSGVYLLHIITNDGVLNNQLIKK